MQAPTAKVNVISSIKSTMVVAASASPLSLSPMHLMAVRGFLFHFKSDFQVVWHVEGKIFLVFQNFQDKARGNKKSVSHLLKLDHRQAAAMEQQSILI